MLTQKGRHIRSKQLASHMSQGHERKTDERHHERTAYPSDTGTWSENTIQITTRTQMFG
jgi:hypothetical protein